MQGEPSMTTTATDVDTPRSGRLRNAAAVGGTFAQIMAERHPGTRWLPVKGANGGAATGAGKLVVILPAPDDLDSIGDLPTPTPDIDDVDSRGEKTLALSGV